MYPKIGLRLKTGEDLRDYAEERQRQNVDLGMAEEPEQVLPQHDSTGGGVEQVRSQVPVHPQSDQGSSEQRKNEEDQHAGDQRIPREDRHAEHRHTRGAQADDRRNDVDCAEDGADPPTESETDDPQVGACRGEWSSLVSGT